jgi:hypothetical protein
VKKVESGVARLIPAIIGKPNIINAMDKERIAFRAEDSPNILDFLNNA